MVEDRRFNPSKKEPFDVDFFTSFVESQEYRLGTWRQHAACLFADQDLFFVARGESNYEAKQMCYSCPVRRECLSYALVTFQKYGIWGGRSSRDRQKIRRKLNAQLRLRNRRELSNV